jgi:membrane-associated protease RseP (regulator of RpoE activity)
MAWLAGAGIFFLGLMVSIALHELGHLSFAKLFGVRTTQFMVGFGPTLWSRNKGETEYGLKWIPLGGYIRMIGMLPPRKDDPDGYIRRSSTGRFQTLVDSAREGALEEVRPGDEDRVFYGKKWWQKLLIMFGGPAMNLLLAVFFFAILLMGIGTLAPQPVVSSVAKCTVAVTAKIQDCPANYVPTPAARVGLQARDRIVSYDGTAIGSYTQLQKLIRASGGRTVAVIVDRQGKRIAFQVPVTTNQMQDLKDPNKVVNTGFLGITPLEGWQTQGPGAVAGMMTDLTGRTLSGLANMPTKMVGVWNAAFSGQKRDPNGPIGVVGVSRIGGEILASKNPLKEKVASFIFLLGSINLAVGLFNLVPLLPLDGGHIAGALWEAVKRGFARLTHRPDPGYVDVAKALPLTYAMAAVFMVMGALLIYADVFNPIHLSG